MKPWFFRFFPRTLASLACLPAMVVALPIAVRADEAAVPAPATKPEPAAKAVGIPNLEEAVKQLKLPGVEINLKEQCVDVASSICLVEGTLELIACTKDTKEHESIIVIEAISKHVHTALLLLGAIPGNPAMRKALDDEGTRWVDLPPRGGAVDVFLVFPDKTGKVVERPISDFIVSVGDNNDPSTGQVQTDTKKERFPTHTFVFAGSILDGEGTGHRRYLSDLSGDVISIATFGDELLSLPEVHADANDQLMWGIDGTDLPAVGTKVTLRLRPKLPVRPAPAADKAQDKVQDKAPK